MSDRLLEAAKALSQKLEQVGEDSIGVFHLAQIHGMEYTGATYNEELDELRAAIKEVESEQTSM